MDRAFFEYSLKTLSFQRNFLLILSLLLTIGIILVSSFLFLKTERVVVVPAVVEKEFWVESNAISPTYLEQFGHFLGQLLFSKSSHSADLHRTILCRHTDPSYLYPLKQRLIEEEEILKKQNASYVFYLNNLVTDPRLLTVTLFGDRQFYIAGQQLSSESSAYTLHFSYVGARLLLKEITHEKNLTLLGER
jgi:conjugal transfer pilus assembly protein TraE